VQCKGDALLEEGIRQNGIYLERREGTPGVHRVSQGRHRPMARSSGRGASDRGNSTDGRKSAHAR
jgi:hypothetical protein